MPGTVPQSTDETELLLAYIAQQRGGVRYAAHGLSEEQVRARPVASSGLSLGGLIKHVALTERHWIVNVLGQVPPGDLDYEGQFSLAEGETLQDVLDLYGEVARETEAVVRRTDLDRRVPIPPAPWFPDEGEWSARWILLHVIEETARHAGHADIVREAIDGATMYELMARAEGWSEAYDAMLANYAQE